MSNKPLVSVIVPCYNEGQYLLECIESIEKQTYKNIEIIVVNDGSTDSCTLEVLSQLDNTKLKVISIDNCGVAIARNVGIKYSKGNFILPIDGDDKIAPQYVERCMNVLLSNKEIDIVYSNTRLFDGKNKIFGLSSFNMKSMLKQNCVVCTAIYRKNDYQLINGYKENMIYGLEDWDFWLTMLANDKKFYCIPDTLFYYRIKKQSRNSTFIKNQDKQKKTFQQLYANNEELYKKYNITLDSIIPTNSLGEKILGKIRELYNIGRIYLIIKINQFR